MNCTPEAEGAQRLSKFLAQAGVASRRAADRLIEQGRVTVNGEAAVLGQKIIPGIDRICVDNKPVRQPEELVYIMLHKPAGYLSTCHDPFGRPIVLSLIPEVDRRVFPVGRLDFDSEGLLLLTNDGYLANLLTHPKHQVIKEYVVEVPGRRDNRKIKQLLSGIIIDGKKVYVDYARFLDSPDGCLRILIGVHEGQKHLVKRLCKAVGCEVKRLIRTRIGPLALFGLEKGKWRYLTQKEVQALYKAARGQGGKEIAMSGNSNMRLRTDKDVKGFNPERNRLYSATHEEILSGATADVYLVRTQEILAREGKADTVVTAEIFPSSPGILAGMPECLHILQGLPLAVWGLEEGDSFDAKEPVLRITGPYSLFGLYETVLLGILASSSAWATRAAECKQAANGLPFVCFGARHIHPAVAPVMERAAVVGGADGAACILGAKLLGLEPVGTIPHAMVLILGDTVKAAVAYNTHMPEDAPRTILVDTFKDECEEALRVADVLGTEMEGIRLDTPGERGGVTEDLVREIRARLNMAGFGHVKIFVSGGLNPEKMTRLAAAGADAFGVGSYIAGAPPINMTMDIKEIEGRPIAKRGRIPGITHNPKLKRLM